jgi:DMSO/TMAO reductase YedYZ heme-binding membrane subunit
MIISFSILIYNHYLQKRVQSVVMFIIYSTLSITILITRTQTHAISYNPLIQDTIMNMDI